MGQKQLFGNRPLLSSKEIVRRWKKTRDGAPSSLFYVGTYYAQGKFVPKQTSFPKKIHHQLIIHGSTKTTNNSHTFIMPLLQCKKTEMVGSFLVSAEQMSHQAASSPSTQEAWHQVMDHHWGQDVKGTVVHSLTTKSEMYGTLLVNTTVQPRLHASPKQHNVKRHAMGSGKAGHWVSVPIDEVSALPHPVLLVFYAHTHKHTHVS